MIITSDLHLTDRPQDEYRWKIFDQLQKEAKKNEPIAILGDLTDQKDKHSAVLVDRIVQAVRRLLVRHPVYILKGNHDYTDPDYPFFGFLEYLPSVTFVSEPELLNGTLFLPHTHNPREDWAELMDPEAGAIDGPVDYVFAHQTFQGAVGSNGMTLSGVGTDWLEKTHGINAPIYSGDIHVPQEVGRVTYIGTPYPVAFNDSYECSISRLDENGFTRIPVSNIRKHQIVIQDVEDLDDYNLSEGDQAKVTLQLLRSDFGRAQGMMTEIRDKASSLGVQLFGFKLEERKIRKRTTIKSKEVEKIKDDPMQVFAKFCEKEGVDKAICEAGKELL